MTVKSFSLIKRAPKFGIRHVQVLFLFTCCTIGFMMRINVSVGIVAMTNANTTNPNFPEYSWSEKEKSYMLSSFFWGAIFTQLMGGYLSSQYGAKQLLLACTLGVSLLSLMTPATIVHGGWQLFCLLRLIQGLFQGVMWPCFYSHLAKWCPVNERNRLGGITQTGLDIGTALGFAVSGLVSASDLGWPGMFYIPGTLGVIWSILWIYFGANTPFESKIISLSERKMIQFSLETTTATTKNTEATKTKVPVPWKRILTSGPFLALTLCKISQATSYHTLMQQIPTYIHGIFKFGIQMNAVLSAVPYVGMCLLSYVFLVVAEIIRKNDVASLTIVRKTINTFASCVPAAALTILAFVSPENVGASITLLVVAVAATSAQAIGSSLNHIDLSPNHAGVLFGITNTLVSVIGVLSPLLVGVIVSDEGDRSQWRIVFILIAVILFFGNLIYVLFGEMVPQAWNEATTEAPSSPSLPSSLNNKNNEQKRLPNSFNELEASANDKLTPLPSYKFII